MAQVIPAPFLYMEMECGECDGCRDTPDRVLGHLCVMHNYTEGEAEHVINAWMDGFETDENGIPFVDYCVTHGNIRYGEGCHGCDREDQEWEYAKERYHENA